MSNCKEAIKELVLTQLRGDYSTGARIIPIRFISSAKAGREERNAGCEKLTKLPEDAKVANLDPDALHFIAYTDDGHCVIHVEVGE